MHQGNMLSSNNSAICQYYRRAASSADLRIMDPLNIGSTPTEKETDFTAASAKHFLARPWAPHIAHMRSLGNSGALLWGKTSVVLLLALAWAFFVHQCAHMISSVARRVAEGQNSRMMADSFRGDGSPEHQEGELSRDLNYCGATPLQDEDPFENSFLDSMYEMLVQVEAEVAGESDDGEANMGSGMLYGKFRGIQQTRDTSAASPELRGSLLNSGVGASCAPKAQNPTPISPAALNSSPSVQGSKLYELGCQLSALMTLRRSLLGRIVTTGKMLSWKPEESALVVPLTAGVSSQEMSSGEARLQVKYPEGQKTDMVEESSRIAWEGASGSSFLPHRPGYWETKFSTLALISDRSRGQVGDTGGKEALLRAYLSSGAVTSTHDTPPQGGELLHIIPLSEAYFSNVPNVPVFKSLDCWNIDRKYIGSKPNNGYVVTNVRILEEMLAKTNLSHPDCRIVLHKAEMLLGRLGRVNFFTARANPYKCIARSVGILLRAVAALYRITEIFKEITGPDHWWHHLFEQIGVDKMELQMERFSRTKHLHFFKGCLHTLQLYKERVAVPSYFVANLINIYETVYRPDSR